MVDRVIISAKRDGDSNARDLEVPTGMPIRQLVTLIARALGWDMDTQGNPIHYKVGAQPPGRILRENETLAQAQAWDGSYLIFYPSHKPGAPQPLGEGPMKGLAHSWKPIKVDDSSSLQPGQPPPSGLQWKRIDDD